MRSGRLVALVHIVVLVVVVVVVVVKLVPGSLIRISITVDRSRVA